MKKTRLYFRPGCEELYSLVKGDEVGGLMKQIKTNKIRCKFCGDIIESVYRYDFVTCKCGKCFVDGGKDYLRRGYYTVDPNDSYEELSEYFEEETK